MQFSFYLSVSMFVCVSVCLAVFLSVCSVCLSVCLSVCRPVSLCVCLPACLLFCLSVCLLARLSVYGLVRVFASALSHEDNGTKASALFPQTTLPLISLHSQRHTRGEHASSKYPGCYRLPSAAADPVGIRRILGICMRACDQEPPSCTPRRTRL